MVNYLLVILRCCYLLGLCCQWCLWLWCPWYGWVALKQEGLFLGQQVVYKAGMEFLHPSQLEIFCCLFKHQLVIWYFEKLHTAMILHDHNLFKGCSYNVWCGVGSSLHYRFLEVWTFLVLFGFPWSMCLFELQFAKKISRFYNNSPSRSMSIWAISFMGVTLFHLKDQHIKEHISGSLWNTLTWSYDILCTWVYILQSFFEMSNF